MKFCGEFRRISRISKVLPLKILMKFGELMDYHLLSWYTSLLVVFGEGLMCSPRIPDVNSRNSVWNFDGIREILSVNFENFIEIFGQQVC